MTLTYTPLARFNHMTISNGNWVGVCLAQSGAFREAGNQGIVFPMLGTRCLRKESSPFRTSGEAGMLVARSLRSPLLRTPESTLWVSQKQNPLFWKSSRPPVDTVHRDLTPSVSKIDHLTPFPLLLLQAHCPQASVFPCVFSPSQTPGDSWTPSHSFQSSHQVAPPPCQPPLLLPPLGSCTLARITTATSGLSLLCLPVLSSFSLTDSFSYTCRWLSMQSLITWSSRGDPAPLSTQAVTVLGAWALTWDASLRLPSQECSFPHLPQCELLVIC